MTSPLTKAPPIGEAHERERLKDATSYTYYKTDQGDLSAHFFFPPDYDPENKKTAALLCLHGGQWDISSPTQFIPHCHHFASRGMVTVCIEYRTFQKHRTSPLEAIEDAQMAIGFLRDNADILGVDVGKITVMAAASGAHLALCATVHPETVQEPQEMFRPNALILFAPITDTSKKGLGSELFADPKQAKLTSPLTSLPQKNLPPCLVFHSKDDRVVPFDHSKKLHKLYSKKRNTCQLVDFEKSGHSFFNFNVNEQHYLNTLRAADHFLVDLGHLAPDPLVDELY